MSHENGAVVCNTQIILPCGIVTTTVRMVHIIMIYLTGDINLTDSYFDTGFGIGSKLSKGFNPFVNLERNDEEFWVGNFEGVAADVTKNRGTSAQHFRVSPQCLSRLHHMDVYGFANNHAMQHGEEAYKQTLSALYAQGAKCFGMDNCHSIVIEHQGRQISLTGFSQRIDVWSKKPLYWHNPEYLELESEVRKLPKEAFKIAYVHWGNEFINYPSSSQKRFAHWLVDVGFDIVVGMHPHILQGYEVYSGRYIFYSLGNFVFDMAWEPTHYGAIVTIDFSQPQAVIGYQYVHIGVDFAPTIIDEKDVPEVYRFEYLNGLLSKEENSEEYHATINKYYKKYRKANHRDIMQKMIAHPGSAVGVLSDFIKRRF